MGNRKNRIKAQKVFDELGFGRVNTPNTPLQYQVKSFVVLTMHKIYKIGIVYDDYAFGNSRIEKWRNPFYDTFRGKKERVSAGYFQLENGGCVYSSQMVIGDEYGKRRQKATTNWRLLKKNWRYDLYLGPEDMVAPKTREQIEARLLAFGAPHAPWVDKNDKRTTRPEIVRILESGGHVHDEDGFLLPEFSDIMHRGYDTIHPLVLNPHTY